MPKITDLELYKKIIYKKARYTHWKTLVDQLICEIFLIREDVRKIREDIKKALEKK